MQTPPPAATRLADVRASDAPLPRFLRGREAPPERPVYDSVVIAGGGIGALTLAARLARSDAFAGRVTLAAPAVEDTRRLIGGLTLRARALDYYGVAFGETRDALLSLLFDGREDEATIREQHGGFCSEDTPDSVRVVRSQAWMSQSDCGGVPLGYGVRNSHLAARLEALVSQLPVELHRERVDSLPALRSLAKGSRPLIVNAGPKPLREHPEARSEAPRAFVLASQLPFAARARRERGILPDQASFFAFLLHEGRSDLGVFNPLVDPLSPEADYYGILFRIVPASRAAEREKEIDRLHAELVRVARALGMEPVDAEETEGRAMVPCADWKRSRRLEGEVLPLHRIVHAGRPIITGDGMTKAGLAAVAAAEAILAGEDPALHATRALSRWRLQNRMLALGMTTLAPLASRLIARGPRRMLAGAGQRDFWASVATR